MINEIELKLLVAESDIARLLRQPLLRSASPSKTRKLLSIYFDTPELELHEKKIALRIRRDGSHWIQTVKDGGSVLAGLHSRNEWEYPVAKKVPDFTRLPDSAPRALFLRLDGRLAPIFETRFSRLTRMIEFEKSTIEFSLDRGEVVAGNQRCPLCEIELELKSGQPAKLFALAKRLAVPLKIENVSKAERGYALHGGKSTNRVLKATVVPLGREMDLGQAFSAIVGNCLEHLQGNARGVAWGEADPEYVHQLRVAARRMRAAFPVFAKAFGKKADFSSLGAEAKWLASELSAARDWDVFVLQTLPATHHELKELAAAAAQSRASANERARAAAESGRFQAFLLALGELLVSESLGKGKTNLFDFAETMLKKRYRRLKKMGRHIGSLTDSELHALRIAAKKLRYAAEFFAPLYGEKPCRRFVLAMAALQDDLGRINDAATTQSLLAPLAERLPAEVALVVNWIKEREKAQRAKLDGLWREFAATPTFW